MGAPGSRGGGREDQVQDRVNLQWSHRRSGLQRSQVHLLEVYPVTGGYVGARAERWGGHADAGAGIGIDQNDRASSKSGTRAPGWKEGDRFRNLPNLGSDERTGNKIAAAFARRCGVESPSLTLTELRQVFKSHRGKRLPSGGRFLRVERELFENQGRRYNSQSGAYHPPGN